jgi:hypothetical protein
MRLCLWTAGTNGPIVHPPGKVWVWRDTVEWDLQGKIEELGGKTVPVPLCPSQIPHGLTQVRTLASAVRGRRVTAWTMARPCNVSLGTICCGPWLYSRKGALLDEWVTPLHPLLWPTRISRDVRSDYPLNSQIQLQTEDPSTVVSLPRTEHYLINDGTSAKGSLNKSACDASPGF